MNRDPLSELEGRLAAMELVLALVLGSSCRARLGAAWPRASDQAMNDAIEELRRDLHGHAAAEALTTLRLIFERSNQGFQIEDCRTDSSAGRHLGMN